MQKYLFNKIAFLSFIACTFISLVSVFYCVTLVEAGSSLSVELSNYQEDLIKAQYPHVDGLANKQIQEKMNNNIKAIIDEKLGELQKRKNEATSKGNLRYTPYGNITVEIEFNNGAFFSLMVCRTDDFFERQVSHLYGYTFNTNNGELVNFSNLFQWNDRMRNYLFDTIKGEVIDDNYLTLRPGPNNKQKNPLVNRYREKDLYDKINEPQYMPNYYLIDKDKIVIIFKTYEIADGASGPLRFEISIPSELKNK